MSRNQFVSDSYTDQKAILGTSISMQEYADTKGRNSYRSNSSRNTSLSLGPKNMILPSEIALNQFKKSKNIINSLNTNNDNIKLKSESKSPNRIGNPYI